MVMTPIGEALKKNIQKREFWQNELKSLCVEPDSHRMSLMTEEDLQALAERYW
jgi:hypothetical protein